MLLRCIYFIQQLLENQYIFSKLQENCLIKQKEVLILYETDKTVMLIKNMAKQKGIKTTDMLIECDLNKNALSSMQSRGSWLQANNLAKIADYLDCSVDYLLGRTNNPDSHNL